MIDSFIYRKISLVKSSQLMLEVAARKIHTEVTCRIAVSDFLLLFVVETAVAFSKTFEGTCQVSTGTFLQKEL